MVTRDIASLKTLMRSVPDFPKKGIIFRDITTVLQDKQAFRKAIALLFAHYKGRRIDKVVSIEARGFIFGSVLAYRLGAGFVPVRKVNKLPSETIREEYALEYGTDALEIHTDAITKGERVLIVDDLLATGGTVAAACRLVERLKGKITGLAFFIELPFLKGRSKLDGYEIYSVISYETEEERVAGSA